MKNDDEDSSLRVNGLWKASRGWWESGTSSGRWTSLPSCSSESAYPAHKI